jgi:hypothetical protein
VPLSDSHGEQVRLFLQSPVVSDKVKEGLKKAQGLRREWARAQREVAEQQRPLQAMAEDQGRLRANLREVPQPSPLHRRCPDKLGRQEDEAEKYRADIKRLQGQKHARKKALMYLQDERRMQGLVYLLSLALRVLTLLEWVARERLRQEGAKLQGVYAGQPGRKTDRPSAELLLGAMKAISVSVVEINGQTLALLSPLTEVHRRLLELWDLPSDLYEKLVRGFPIPPPDTSELSAARPETVRVTERERA